MIRLFSFGWPVSGRHMRKMPARFKTCPAQGADRPTLQYRPDFWQHRPKFAGKGPIMTATHLKAVPGGPAANRSDEEWRLRRELAACYRLIAHFRMTDLIFTHISLRVPGPEHPFLINPYGLFFDEITASNLVKIGLDGRAVEPTSQIV